LRSLADSKPGSVEPEAKLGAQTGSVRVLKYGVPSRTFGVN
jgi:pilus assembly protein CpaB